MKLEQLPAAAPEMSDAEAQAKVMERKREAAKQAQSVGDMNSRFKSGIDDLLQNPEGEPAAAAPVVSPTGQLAYGEGTSKSDGVAPEALRRVATQHVEEMEQASEGKQSITLMHEDPTTLGKNRIGGGDGAMELNGAMFEELDGTRSAIEKIDITFYHERAHGGQVDAPLQWLEGHAEIRGNEDAGLGMTYRRPGQPQNLYAEGQDTVEEAVGVLGRDTVERGMTQRFGIIVEGLQQSQSAKAKNLLADLYDQSPEMIENAGNN